MPFCFSRCSIFSWQPLQKRLRGAARILFVGMVFPQSSHWPNRPASMRVSVSRMFRMSFQSLSLMISVTIRSSSTAARSRGSASSMRSFFISSTILLLAPCSSSILRTRTSLIYWICSRFIFPPLLHGTRIHSIDRRHPPQALAMSERTVTSVSTRGCPKPLLKILSTPGRIMLATISSANRTRPF